ncbi:MAG: TerC family protein [Peptococcaceae bacterium]|nr:TerC family protein [Peptococcaceae bacterium]
MEFFSPEFWSTLLAIVVIDLALAGDNAIVIGLAARNLPKEQQKKVIILGTLGAIVIRSIATLLVVWLLKIPGLLFIGGLMLIWIAYKLLVEEQGHGNMKPGESLWAAVRTIIIADAVMGLDNVLAVAGAAHGSFVLVVIGLLISVPIVVWGSTIIIKWVERYPNIIYVGSAVLAWTAAKMIVEEHFLAGIFHGNTILKGTVTIIIIAGVLLAGKIKNNKKDPNNA